ncbi:MAG TPA: thioredoxin [Candidatus Caccousia avistercoris]|nr:thioredoxin [Candidatus Caccousia avistercoris]
MAVITLTKDNFQSEALESKLPVLVDFWAPWCGPCRMVSPIVDEVAGELEGKVKVGKVNVDEQPELAAQYGVMSIPTLLVLENGQVKESSVGARPKAAILAMLGM